MKVLGIYGSPRPRGNSDLLLEAALRGAETVGAEVKRIYVRELALSGCLECGGCDESGECVQDDDMQKVYPLLDEAEVIILAAPIFFYSFPSQLKALIDRAQARWSRRQLIKAGRVEKKESGGRGWLIAVGATRGRNLFAGVELTARYFFDALGKSYEGGIFFRGVEGRGEIERQPEALEEAYQLGRRVAEKSSLAAN